MTVEKSGGQKEGMTIEYYESILDSIAGSVLTDPPTINIATDAVTEIIKLVKKEIEVIRKPIFKHDNK